MRLYSYYELQSEIKSILVESIKLAICLKQQIVNLLRHLKAIDTIIDLSIKLHVEPFLDTIKLALAQGGSDPYNNLRIGQFTLTDFQRTVSQSTMG
jgi:hypothetical protein